MNGRRVHQPPPHPLLGLMMNSCFGTRFHSSVPKNLTMSSRQFVLHLFFTDILSLSYPDTNRIWISVRYDGWDNFPRVMMLVLWWPGNMMSCLPPLAGGPIIIISFARITILPRGNCKTYFISCSWWIICVSKVWPLIEHHIIATSKHDYDTPALQQEHWRRDAKCFLSVIQTPLYG